MGLNIKSDSEELGAPLRAERLEGWPLARSRLWPSLETRAILRGARSKWGTRASG